MRGFLITFLLSGAGGLVGVRVVAWLDQRYRQPPVSFASDDVAYFPRAVMLRSGAMALVAAWASILAAFLSIALASLGHSATTSVFVTLLGLFFGCASLYVAVAALVRCPKCDMRVFSQPSLPPYPDVFAGLTGFGATALRVTMRSQFRCVHCGQRFVLNSAFPIGPA